MKDIALSPERRDALVATACKLRTPVQISIRLEGEEVRLKSYLLPLKGAAGSPLRIFQSLTDMPRTLLAEGSRIRVTFLSDGKPHVFLSAILGKAPRSEEILEISYPQELVQTARGSRSFFRLKPQGRIPLVLWTLAGRADAGAVPASVRSDCTIVDISGGGVGVRIASETARSIPRETEVGLSWTLGPGEPPYVMKGVVKSKEILPGARFSKVGVQFLQSTNRLEFQSNVNRLLRFVAEQERREIQRRNR